MAGGTSGRLIVRQRGASAIEFALVFPFLLLILLALLVWSTHFVVQGALSYAAQEGAREALRVNPVAFTDQAEYEHKVLEVVRDEVDRALETLPANWASKVREGWGTSGPGSISDGALRVELQFPQGSPLLFGTEEGLFAGIPLVPGSSITSSAHMPLREVE